MRVLLIGPSPFLLTRNGRIHSQLIEKLTKDGHHVESVVWHHDVGYFLPNEIGKHFFNENILHPFLGQKGELPVFSFEIMKESQPSVVVSIGDYEDTDFLWSIKSIYPHLFKWIAIIPSSADVVSEKNRLALSYADLIVVTSRKAKKAFESVKTNTEYVPYGADRDIFFPLDKLPSELNVINMGKNAQMSNIPAFIKSVVESNVSGSLHTNIDDGGDYDIRCLINRYNGSKNIRIPEKYISVREGLCSDMMNSLYNEHHAVVDCSLQSPTALTMLEAMATGCIPIGMDFGAAGEILNLMPAEFRFSVPFETFLGPKEEEHAIISSKELSDTLRNIKQTHLSNLGWIEEARKMSVNISKNFSKEKFLKNISESVSEIVKSEHCVAIDVY